MAFIPPFTDIRGVQIVIEGDKLGFAYGAQDVSVHESGAYTGEISAGMLAKLGCTYVVVGHSERRDYHAESDELVAAKAAACHRHGLTPIVCVGEKLEVREAGDHVDFVVNQLSESLAGLSTDQLASTVIAYEPVWAIADSWANSSGSVSYTHLRAHETGTNLVCRLLLEKKKLQNMS